MEKFSGRQEVSWANELKEKKTSEWVEKRWKIMWKRLEKLGKYSKRQEGSGTNEVEEKKKQQVNEK